MNQHFFTDIEALGIPGIGDILSIGLVHFDPINVDIISSNQWNIKGKKVTADSGTIAWWGKQAIQNPKILQQLFSNRIKFKKAYFEIIKILTAIKEDTIYLWADDPQDICWLEYAAYKANLPSFRKYCKFMDSSAITEFFHTKRDLKEFFIKRYQENAKNKHIALCDAENSAIDLMEYWPI